MCAKWVSHFSRVAKSHFGAVFLTCLPKSAFLQQNEAEAAEISTRLKTVREHRFLQSNANA